MLRNLIEQSFNTLFKTLKLKHKDIITSHSHPRDNVYMLIDIAPDDAYQYWSKSPTTRLNSSWQQVRELYYKLKPYCKTIHIVREVSRNGRIHYHANAEVANPYYLSLVVGSISHNGHYRIDYDTIKDINYRTAYLKKDKGLDGHMECILKSPSEAKNT